MIPLQVTPTPRQRGRTSTVLLLAVAASLWSCYDAAHNPPLIEDLVAVLGDDFRPCEAWLGGFDHGAWEAPAGPADLIPGPRCDEQPSSGDRRARF